MKAGRPRTKNRAEVVNKATMVHVPLSEIQGQRLTEMAEADHRKKTDFIRLLIDEEWKRRGVAALDPATLEVGGR